MSMVTIPADDQLIKTSKQGLQYIFEVIHGAQEKYGSVAFCSLMCHVSKRSNLLDSYREVLEKLKTAFNESFKYSLKKKVAYCELFYSLDVLDGFRCFVIVADEDLSINLGKISDSLEGMRDAWKAQAPPAALTSDLVSFPKDVSKVVVLHDGDDNFEFLFEKIMVSVARSLDSLAEDYVEPIDERVWPVNERAFEQFIGQMLYKYYNS